MTTVAKSSNDLAFGPGVLLVAATGTQPTEELGFHADPITTTAERESGKQMVQDVLAVVNHVIVSESFSFSGAIAQVNIDAMERLLGVEKTGESIVFGAGSPQPAEVALRLITTTKDRKPMHIYAPKAVSVGALGMAFGKDEATKLPFTFEAEYDSTLGGLVSLSRSTAAQSLTIATGTAARVNASPGSTIAWLKFAGESAAADALTDITADTEGTSLALANNEIVRVQIANVAQPITVTHASGVIETKTSADFVMTKLADWIDFYYDLTATTWKEIARYDAP